jgi:hypothetical protein
MAQRKSEDKVTVDQVLKLVEKLSPEDQEELRQAFLQDEEDIHICLERLKNPKTISHQELKKQIGLAD